MAFILKDNMEYHVKRVPLRFLFFLMWFLLTLYVKSMSMKRSSYIIHMEESHMPKAFTTHHNWYVSTINSLQFASPTLLDNHRSIPSLLYTYNNVLHGFSAVLTLDELEALKKCHGFISAYIDTTVTLATTRTPSFLSLNVPNGLWNVSNYGKGIIMGILDSGVWPESPSFNDKGMPTRVPSKWNGICEGGEDFNSSMCNSKIIGARYFNEGLKANTNLSKILSKDSARDDVGHGTQVASIAAGNFVDEVSYFGYAKGTAVGVAPHAMLAIYKVLWKEGGTIIDLVAGLDQAVADGVDVINISLDFVLLPLYEDIVAKATFAAMEKGIVVVVAAGNQGPLKRITNGIPWGLTVTASTIDRWLAGSLIFGNGETIFGWSMFPGDTLIQNLPLVYRKTLSSCTSLELYDVKDKIIMCDPGNFSDQTDSIAKSNASGAIIVSDHALLRECRDVRRFPCPCVVISSEEAAVVMSYMKHSALLKVTMNFKQTFTETKPAPILAYYASRGPSSSFPDILKPDIMAPGSWVLAAWVPNIPVTYTGSRTNLYSSYIIDSGTSLACPHVAGVVALLKAAHPNWSTVAISSAIITSANKLDNSNHPIRAYVDNFQYASPFDMGAGHINPNQALDPGLIYDATPQDFVNLLCSKFSKEQVFNITKRYCFNPSLDFNYPSFLSFYSEPKTSFVHKFQRTVTNVGEGATTYKAMMVPPVGTKVEVSPMTLVFQKKYEQQSYNVTITYKGKLRDQEFSFGELIWINNNRKYKVRSPIVLYPK